MGNFIKNPEYFEDFLHNMNEAQKRMNKSEKYYEGKKWENEVNKWSKLALKNQNKRKTVEGKIEVVLTKEIKTFYNTSKNLEKSVKGLFSKKKEKEKKNNKRINF